MQLAIVAYCTVFSECV